MVAFANNKPPIDAPRWLSVDQIRKQQRMRWQAVVDAMERGDLPYEQRGRIRYARVSDVEEWERKRLAGRETQRGEIRADLAHLL